MIKIKLRMKDAIAFFGSKAEIADLCGYTRGAISQWSMDDMAQDAGFKLAYISKLPQFRRKGKLEHEITIE